MKDELDILFSRDESDIEKIAENYPAAGQQEKEKIYEICKRKYNKEKSKGVEESEKDGYIKQAEGVEVYKRPKLYRILSAAAALVIVAGGVGGYAFMKNRNSAEFGAGSTETTEIEPGVPQGLIDELNAMTDEMLSKLERLEGFHYGRGVDTADNFKGSMVIAEGLDSDQSREKIDLNYCRVTDEELDSVEEMRAFCKSFLVGELYSERIIDDFMGADADEENSEFSRHIGAYFIMYNDKFYSRDIASEEHSFCLTEFSRYELISSEFYDENEEGERTSVFGYGNDVIKCERVYKKSDNRLIQINLDFVKEDDENGAAWKIGSWDICEKDSEGTVCARQVSPNTFDPKLIKETDDDSEFAELQLHEMIVLHSDKELDEYYDKINDAKKEGVYKFKKVDVDKYVDQILAAKNSDELNTLENKSFLYHIMINSSRYFDTAETKYVYLVNYPENRYEGENVVDNRNYYSYLEESGYYHDHYSERLEIYDNKDYVSISQQYKRYFKRELTDEELLMMDSYLPDNYRVIFSDDYEDGYITPALEFVDSSAILCSHQFSYTLLANFDEWEIDGIEKILDRDCVHIFKKCELGSTNTELWLDIRTGLLLKGKEIYEDSDGAVDEFEITELKLNEPIQKREYDITGYTDTSNENYQNEMVED
ncbi:MAG: DUF4330 domain-containing protein [Ruminococcus sp.]|uniref:hypothetical protein n=1 Tax=Ruminococcus sp. TaxID=41978 RepID=UPI0025DB7F12|nr:hypothetical protein [Ruminococcus sp.]MCR4794778.1 DUF4330 domain-containing protein [Ruminococcus sp.]